MADQKEEERRLATLQEAAINETLNHPNLVMTFASEMSPLGDLNVRIGGGRRVEGPGHDVFLSSFCYQIIQKSRLKQLKQ
jgi:hypothetical protein